ncbi:hypothetical protein D3C81_2179180 [compost metagenome]
MQVEQLAVIVPILAAIGFVGDEFLQELLLDMGHHLIQAVLQILDELLLALMLPDVLHKLLQGILNHRFIAGL